MHEYYWTLVFEPGWVQSAIWKLEDGRVDIISVSKPASWEEHNMVEVVDATLTDAANDFPDDEKEPSKTVFGVPPFWVEEGKIKKEVLNNIKEICSKLSLSPTGFVVMPEAIAHTSKVRDGNPLTSIILGISDKLIDLTVFKLGNLVGTVSVGRSVSLTEDVEEGLTRFGISGSLPTRFLIYGGNAKELDGIKQELVKVEWGDMKGKDLSFLHTPQFEIVSFSDKAIAVSVAGASEIGEVKEVKTLGVQVQPAESSHIQAGGEAANLVETKDLTAADIGFVLDQDIAEVPHSIPSDETSFGAQQEPKKESNIGRPKFSVKRPKVSLPKISFGFSKVKLILIIILITLFTTVGGVGAAWWYLPKAEVVIFVSPKTLEEEEAITLDENIDSVNFEENIFPAATLSIEVQDTIEKKSTGVITVGEKANGSVTVRNGTSESVQLKVGTLLSGPGGLKFEVIESASVSAALSPTEPGEATVEAQAADIGAEYNTAKDETMSVGGFSKSEVDAIVSTTFSGGSSRDIIAVSQNDLDSLENEILADLRRKGITEIEKTAQNSRFIPESVETEVIDKSFSASVGEESESVSLTLTILVTGIAIDNSVIENLAISLLKDQIPEGFKLRNENIEASFELVEVVDDGLFDFDVRLVAKLLPEVNIDDIIKNIMGLYPPNAIELLSNIPGFSKAEVSLNPRFPGRFGVIPRIEKNISIEIVAER